MTADFTAKYGPWALVAGASDGVGAAMADRLAGHGLNVVLVARRAELLTELALRIGTRTGAQIRTLPVDLSGPDASHEIITATADLEIGLLAYCAGADARFQPFLATPIKHAEAMIHRNCVVPTQLSHHFGGAMVPPRPPL